MASARGEAGIGTGGRTILEGAAWGALVALTRLASGSAAEGLDFRRLGVRRLGLMRLELSRLCFECSVRRRQRAAAAATDWPNGIADNRAEHRRWMAPRLQEQRVGDDGDDGGEGKRARDHVFRAMQQNAHRKAAFGVRDRSAFAPRRRRGMSSSPGLRLGTFLHLIGLFLGCGSRCRRQRGDIA